MGSANGRNVRTARSRMQSTRERFTRHEIDAPTALNEITAIKVDVRSGALPIAGGDAAAIVAALDGLIMGFSALITPPAPAPAPASAAAAAAAAAIPAAAAVPVAAPIPAAAPAAVALGAPAAAAAGAGAGAAAAAAAAVPDIQPLYEANEESHDFMYGREQLRLAGVAAGYTPPSAVAATRDAAIDAAADVVRLSFPAAGGGDFGKTVRDSIRGIVADAYDAGYDIAAAGVLSALPTFVGTFVSAGNTTLIGSRADHLDQSRGLGFFDYDGAKKN
jgi:hypothetical protein